MANTFEHIQSAHCESGVAVNLLRHHQLPLSEPMVFGIGSGLFFGHLPFVKINGLPGTTYRIFPGMIFSRVCRRLGIRMYKEKFHREAKAMDALDRVLDTGKPVGLLCSVYYLPYLPEALRFHFNAHNLVVYGKRANTYLVSDPVLETVTEIDAADLQRARFAKGALAPNGRMYYPIHVPQEVDLRQPILSGIRQTSNDMIFVPVPMFGIRGERFLANQIRKYPSKLEPRKAIAYLGNIVRMQEEIGTGGAGFRFIYAAFLQESGQLLQREDLLQAAQQMTHIGDQWRDFAYTAGRICKNRSTDGEGYDHLADRLLTIADQEKALFNQLRKLRW